MYSYQYSTFYYKKRYDWRSRLSGECVGGGGGGWFQGPTHFLVTAFHKVHARTRKGK